MTTYRIGMYIKKLLQRQGKTQTELANYLGVSKQVLSNNLRGANNLSIDKLLIIADYLDTPVEKILDRSMRDVIDPKRYCNLSRNELLQYEYPRHLDVYGKCAIDYLHEKEKIGTFIFMFRNEVFPNDRFTKAKICAFAIKNSLTKFLTEQLPEKMLSIDDKNIKKINGSLFPRISSSNRLINSENTIEIMNENYDLSILDYIDAVMHCSEKTILDWVPDSFRKTSTKKRRGRGRNLGKDSLQGNIQNSENAKKNKLILIEYSIFMKLAIETGNLFILEYFTKRYNYKFRKRHLNLAIKFGSKSCEEFILMNMTSE